MTLLSVVVAFAACTGQRHDAEQLGASVKAAGDACIDVGAGSEGSSPPSIADAGSQLSQAGPADAGSLQTLGVPRTRARIRPTGHFNVKIWGSAANTRTLLDSDGRGAVPVSEARFLWGDGQLYVFFYAGDLDLQVRTAKHDGPVWKDDSVELSFFSADGTKRVIQISPKGVIADGTCPSDASDLGDPRCDLKWESGVRVAADYDGTMNTVNDFDEEWAVEIALPLGALRLGKPGAETRIPFRIRRCEVAYDGIHSCGLWGGHGGVLELGT